MRRPAMSLTWRDALALLWLALLLVALANVRAGGLGGVEAKDDARGRPRDVPLARLRDRIAAGQLSMHPARWVRSRGEGGERETRAARRSAEGSGAGRAGRRLPAPLRELVPGAGRLSPDPGAAPTSAAAPGRSGPPAPPAP